MLISMPTGTSTIFGVFQVIWISQVIGAKLAPLKRRADTCLTQVPGQIARRKNRAYFINRNNARPAGVFNSLASNVPSPSGSVALKRCSTTARYSSMVNVPS